MSIAKYDDKAIQEFGHIAWIRYNPANHIPDSSIAGRLHVFRELFDNALDEAEHPNSPGDTISIYMFRDIPNNTYQLMIKDNGRGIPHGAIVRSFTQLFNSGKYSNSVEGAYTFSAGSNGFGSKINFALSIDFRAIVVRDGYFSSIYAHDANVDKLIHESNIEANPSLHGTMVVSAPLETVFTEAEEFLENGYKGLTKLCYIISMFSKKINITFKIVDEPLNPRFWKLPADKAWDYIEKSYDKKAYIEVDGGNYEATMEYLKELWQLPNNEKFLWNLTNITHEFSNDISYDISLYLPKTMRSTNAIFMVNNVPLTDQSSSPLSVLITSLKNKLVNYVKDDFKEYFLTIYKLPLCCAISCKCIAAKFTGLAKNGFKNREFERIYERYLTKDLNKVFEDEWQNLYELIAKDIEVKYSVYYNKPLTKKSNKSSAEIIKPIYYDCKTSDRSQAEVYLVEGISASHITDVRDPETQALLMIYGKPKNVLKTGAKDRNAISLFNGYEAYQTLEKILNIHPKQTDLSTANFGKIILMNDADIDGGHIQALHLGALHTLNPRIIEEGMVYLANPPLYELNLGTNRNGKQQYKYIQDKNSLIRFFIEAIYRNTFDIYVMDGVYHKEPTLLDYDSFTDFCYIITCIGEIFANLSARLAAPMFILEQLTHLTQYLQPGAIRGDRITHYLGPKTNYSKNTDILTVIGNRQDYSFSLEGVAEAFYEELLSYLRQIYWRDLKIFVSTKFTDALVMKQVSITQLYEMFLSLTKQLEVTRQKGLGGMDENDLYPLCINKETRVLHQITSLGDLDRIKALLGDDVTARKNILKEHNIQVE